MLSSALLSCDARVVADEAFSATPAAGRLLTARLGYTAVQRGAGPLSHRRVGDGFLQSFDYRVLGLPTGLHEGVLLGPANLGLMPGLMRLAEDIGATLLKVTCAASGPMIPGRIQTERQRLWTVVNRDTRARELLPLLPTYEDTLAGFGRHTRRNVRNARKVGADSGMIFEASLDATLISTSDHVALARKTRPNGVRISLSRRLEAHAARSGRPFRSIVRAADGEIVSYACGYLGYQGDSATAYLLYQLNNPAFHALSPSLLHRAHLIEWLIGRGCEELVFVHGCTGVLQHACVRQPLQEVFLLRRTPAGYLAASPIAFAKADSSLGRLVRAALRPAV